MGGTWVLGVVIALVISMVIVVAIQRLGSQGLDLTPPPLLWDIPRVAGTYTPIVGALAGFTVTSSIFLANLSVVRQSPEFEGVMGLFLLAFLAFMASAMLFGTTPNAVDTSPANFEPIQRFALMFAMLGYYTGIGLSWVALRLLLLAIGLNYLAGIFIWVLLFVLFAGGERMGLFLHRLTMVNRYASLGMPLVGFGVAIVYGALLAPSFSGLWPGPNAPLMLGLVCFACGSLCFVTHGLLLSYGNQIPGSLLKRWTPTAALLHAQLVTTSIALVWVAVARA